ncbi:sigma 54-interacting transcriptional regulator [Phycisphaerales bacterium AB-hyl4]|uniref:Sigma 54-interacting transcriptional regulator n=1 Tax=Natronomicrosphaera hydrolytica TaxID=3242702 RepID=A0ABV4U8S9_9BACT
MTSHPTPATLGQLKQTPYRYRSVKQELRENLVRRLQSGDDVFPGILGYKHTVQPQVVHAILSRHDMLFLGLRGQAKTRMLRLLPDLLDEWLPIIDGIEIPDDPIQPMTSMGKRLIREQGDDTPVRWLHRSDRYHEKLATPDVTIADLIGEIDIVKHAEGRYLSDESTMHFGLIPRTNRGIFAVNELPDLSPRIQVGLFNVLEERDVQIRGYPVRLNLDVCLVFSANPEDYTNRGRIVTPLKDRIGSVIRTHYPHTTDEAMQITRGNAWLQRENEPDEAAALPKVDVPDLMLRIVEEAVAQARKSPHINQASGVSVRTSIACIENLVSSAERRGLITGEPRVVPRVCDLQHILASTRGKIELMLADDGDATEDKLVTSLVGEAVKAIFDQVADVDEYEAIVEPFEEGLKLTVGDEVSAAEQIASMKHVKGLLPATTKLAKKLGLDEKDEQLLACAGEFLLEALYVHNRLSKHGGPGESRYSR